MRKPITTLVKAEPYRLNYSCRPNSDDFRSLRAFATSRNTSNYGELKHEILIDAPGFTVKQAQSFAKALGAMAKLQLAKLTKSSAKSFEELAREAVRRTTAEKNYLVPRYQTPFGPSVNSRQRLPVVIRWLSRNRYELIPNRQGAVERAAKVATVRAAIKDQTVLRFLYKKLDARSHETVRVLVHGIYETKSGEYYFTATREDSKLGALRRSYSFAHATEIFAETESCLSTSLRVRLRLYTENATVDVESLK